MDSGRVYVRFVGSEDHLEVRAGQAGHVWLCSAWPWFAPSTLLAGVASGASPGSGGTAIAGSPPSGPAPRATIGGMARFYTYAEVLTTDHLQWEVHARGLGCGHGPGLVLQEVLDRSGGRYEVTMPMSDGIREQARICAQVSGDEEIARIASLSEVTISLEHLRGLDPGTRIVCGYGLGDFTDAERGRLPRGEGSADPATIIEGPFDPANPRRILRTPAGG